MIKGVMGTTGVIVDGGNTSLPYHSPNVGDGFSGVLRLSGSDIQYYSNGAWTSLPTSYATVRLDPHTDSLLKWCEAQRTMAFRRTEMAAQHPALEKALAAIQRAEDNYDILAKFVENDKDDSNVLSP